jgi:outer membrane immunogenic protein
MSKSVVSLAVGAMTIFAATGVQAEWWSSPTNVNWTGFYLGGQGTYRWASADVNFVDVPGLETSGSLSSDDWMGGVHGGVQQQFGLWVLGVDLSGDWGGSGDTRNFSFASGGITGNGNASAGIDSIFTATGRLGYVWSNVMLYAKGGYASIDLSANGSVTELGGVDCDPNCSFSGDKSHSGWIVGGGLEWMFAQNVSFGLDYSFIDIGSETIRFDPGPAFDEIAVRVEPDNIQTLSARLTFHFNAPRETYVPIK